MSENVVSLKKGLTGFQVKILALILMLFDHIHYFFEFTGKVPLIFSQIGRIAAPLFLFMVIEGFSHTSNRKKYMGRVYFLSIFMGTINYLIITFFQRKDGFFPQNNICGTFIVILVILQGVEFIKSNKKPLGILLILVPFLLNALFFIVPKSLKKVAYVGVCTVLPLPMFSEGGLLFILTGVLLYLFRENRKLQVLVFCGVTLLGDIGGVFLMAPNVTFSGFFNEYYDWMSIAASIFMLRYNGEKGKSIKKLFYVFYPAHIYILYLISFFIIK